MTLLIFILVLSVLVLIHEFGHYLVARKNGIRVKEFGLGYPPRVLKLFHYRGTDFTLNLIPLGGFVQLEGEDGPDDEEEKIATIPLANKYGKAFFAASTKAKLLTVLAGIIANLLFAVVAFTFIFSKTGIPFSLSNQARISEVSPGSPAATAGLQANSNILALKSSEGDWQTVSQIAEVQDFVKAHQGEQIWLRSITDCQVETCSGPTEEKELYLRLPEEVPQGEGSMGVIFMDTYTRWYPWYQMPFVSAYYGTRQALELVLLILQSLGTLLVSLFQGQSVADEVAGPVGIVHQASEYGYFSGGFLSILNFAALLSVNLGIMNLLPIPALDGGRAVFLILEHFFPQKKMKKISQYANSIGFMLLLFLMFLISVHDVWRIFAAQ